MWTCVADLEELGRPTVSYARLGFISISLFFTLSGDITSRDDVKYWYIVPWMDFLCVYTPPKLYIVEVVILFIHPATLPTVPAGYLGYLHYSAVVHTFPLFPAIYNPSCHCHNHHHTNGGNDSNKNNWTKK